MFYNTSVFAEASLGKSLPGRLEDSPCMTGLDESEIQLTCQVAMHPRMPLICQVVTCQTVTWQAVTCHISMTPAGNILFPRADSAEFGYTVKPGFDLS